MFIFASAASASSVVDIYAGTQCRAIVEGRNVADPLADRLHNWVDANREKLASLLQPEDKEGYAASIAAGRCEDAEAIIAERFQAAFPEMACLLGPDHSRTGSSFIAWQTIVAEPAYPGLAFCVAEKNLGENRAILEKAGVALPLIVYPIDTDDLERDYGDAWVSVLGLGGAVMSIDELCRFDDYQPACVAFARLANEGVLVKKTDDFLYFYLVRIRLAGFDSAERAQLEAEVGARLTPEARARDEAKARASLAGIPQLPDAFPEDRYPGVPAPGDD